jgi:hypothetical protein
MLLSRVTVAGRRIKEESGPVTGECRVDLGNRLLSRLRLIPPTLSFDFCSPPETGRILALHSEPSTAIWRLTTFLIGSRGRLLRKAELKTPTHRCTTPERFTRSFPHRGQRRFAAQNSPSSCSTATTFASDSRTVSQGRPTEWDVG